MIQSILLHFSLQRLIILIITFGLVTCAAIYTFQYEKQNEKVNSIKQLANAMCAALPSFHDKSVYENVADKPLEDITLSPYGQVETHYGYPTADTVLKIVSKIDKFSWVQVASDSSERPYSIAFGFGAGFKCAAWYYEAESASIPAYVELRGTEQGCQINKHEMIEA